MKTMTLCLLLVACSANNASTTNDKPDAPLVDPDGGSNMADASLTIDAPVNPMPDAPQVCTADINNDANNCGACGRSCLGASCSAGQCVAARLDGDGITGIGDFTSDNVFIYYTGFTTGTSANHRLWRRVIGTNTTGDYVAVFSNSSPMSELAFDGSQYFYSAWTDSVNGGEIQKFSKTPFGGAAIQTDMTTTNTAVFLQNGTVYWATDVNQGDAGDIKSTSINTTPTSGAVATVTAAAGQVYYLTGDSTNLYWVDNAGGGLQAALRTAPIAGGPTVAIASGTADYLDMDTNYVYVLFKNTGDVVKVTKSNHSTSTIGHNLTAGVAIDSQHVYGAKANKLVGITKTGTDAGTLWEGLAEGTPGCPTDLKISRVKVIGSYVYFLVLPTTCNNTVLANRIYRVAKL